MGNIIIGKKTHAKCKVLTEYKSQTQRMEETDSVGSRTESTFLISMHMVLY